METLPQVVIACTAALVLALTFTAATPAPAHAASSTPTYKSWKTAYKAVLKDWTIIETTTGYAGCEDYLEMYFGSSYSYNRYFIYNLDKKGAPELFLHSTKMGLTAVFTYRKGKLVYLCYDDFYGINKKQKTLVVQGHWHGAGGTYENEWSGYRMSSLKKISRFFYIDSCTSLSWGASLYSDTGGYYAYYKGTSNYSAKKSKRLYKSLKKKYVKGATKFSKFKKYKLTTTKGLKN